MWRAKSLYSLGMCRLIGKPTDEVRPSPCDHLSEVEISIPLWPIVLNLAVMSQVSRLSLQAPDRTLSMPATAEVGRSPNVTIYIKSFIIERFFIVYDRCHGCVVFLF